MANILIVDDEETFARNAARFLEKGGHGLRVALTAAEGLEACAAFGPDLVVLDYRLPDMDGLTVIGRIRRLDPEVPILMITGHGSIELAVDAMKAGANDLLTKPVALGELRQRIGLLTERQRESSRLRYFEARERDAGQLEALVGDSTLMCELRERIRRIASIEAQETLPPVLIIGETGTGKELVARATHFCSARRDKPFVEVNCAALPANLLESELFGHERGAFTDARERKLGLLEAADGGSLFLDEIGEMDRALQAKLLKVIEDGRVRRLGAVQERQVNVRIVAATNQDLEDHIRQGLFRADLYFRLRVLQINVPPLRERVGDPLQLARHFLAEFGQRYRKSGLSFTPAAEAAPTPGRAMCGSCATWWSRPCCLSPAPASGRPTCCCRAAPRPARPGRRRPAWRPRRSCAVRPWSGVEREMLAQALALTGGNVSRAARELGISRDTLRYRMEKYGIGATFTGP